MAERKTIERTGGELHFPIESEIVVYGSTRKKTMEKETVVKCIFCNAIFRANENTAFKSNDFTYLECPLCGKFADIVYYYDRVINL